MEESEVAMARTCCGARMMLRSVRNDTCVLQGPYPFLVLALTLNLYSVLSSRLAKTVFLSVVLLIRFSSGATAFQNWMSYMVTCPLRDTSGGGSYEISTTSGVWKRVVTFLGESVGTPSGVRYA